MSEAWLIESNGLFAESPTTTGIDCRPSAWYFVDDGDAGTCTDTHEHMHADKKHGFE
jgi:hypothetical protein